MKIIGALELEISGNRNLPRVGELISHQDKEYKVVEITHKTRDVSMGTKTWCIGDNIVEVIKEPIYRD